MGSRFVGRKAELRVLQQAWRGTVDGLPRVVALVGEPRLGKTRIVHEFYRWMSGHEDPSGYWPDTLDIGRNSLSLNPRMDASTSAAGGAREASEDVPWLWWGLRWTQPDPPNGAEASRCAAIDAAQDLAPHLEFARALMVRRRSGREALLGFSKTAANVFTTGAVGTTIELLERAQDLWRLRQSVRSTDATWTDLAAQSDRRVLGELEQAMLALLAPGGVRPEGVPLLLVLDDAQWAEPESLAFVQRVLRALAKRGDARLLVIITCWEREWNAAQARPLSLDASTSPRDVVEAFESLAREAHREGRTKPMLEVCRLGRLGDELVGVVADELPGLTEGQRKAVANRAGGTPGLLTELLLYLQNQPHLFEDEDLGRGLTSYGEGVVRDMTVNYHVLVQGRLQALDARQRWVLRLASFVGYTFPRDLVAGLAHGVGAGALAPIEVEECDRLLRWANDPLAIVQPIDANIDEFRVPAYREVLQAQLAGLTGLETQCRQRALDLVRNKLAGKEFETRPLAERRGWLAFASRALSADDSSELTADERLILLAVWAEQLCDLRLEGRLEPIAQLYARLLPLWAAITGPLVSALTNTQLVEIVFAAVQLERLADADRLAERVLREVSTVTPTGQALELQSKIHQLCAEVAIARNELDLADEHLMEASKSADALLEEEGGDKWLPMGAGVLRRWARLHSLRGHTTAEQISLSRAEHFLRQAIDKRGLNLDCAINLIQVLLRLGELKTQADRPLEVVHALEEALSLARAVVELDPARRGRNIAVALCASRLGNFRSRIGQSEPARQLLGEAIRTGENLIEEFGPDDDRLNVTVWGLLTLASLEAGDAGVALSRRAFELASGDVEARGSGVDRLRLLNVARMSLAETLADRGSDVESLEIARSALAASLDIERIWQGAEYSEDVAVSQEQVANLLARQGSLHEAEALLKEVVYRRSDATDQLHPSPLAVTRLAIAQRRIAEVMIGDGRLQEGRAQLDAAAASYQVLIDKRLDIDTSAAQRRAGVLEVAATASDGMGDSAGAYLRRRWAIGTLWYAIHRFGMTAQLTKEIPILVDKMRTSFSAFASDKLLSFDVQDLIEFEQNVQKAGPTKVDAPLADKLRRHSQARLLASMERVTSARLSELLAQVREARREALASSDVTETILEAQHEFTRRIARRLRTLEALESAHDAHLAVLEVAKTALGRDDASETWWRRRCSAELRLVLSARLLLRNGEALDFAGQGLGSVREYRVRTTSRQAAGRASKISACLSAQVAHIGSQRQGGWDHGSHK